MIEHDTIELLKQCDAGIQMGIAAIDEVQAHATSQTLRSALEAHKRAYAALQTELSEQLARCRTEGKDPNPIAKGMSWIKANLTPGIRESDAKIADFITDGCDMGIKSMSRYLNEYAAADESAKEIARRVISLGERQRAEVRPFL